jgi:hypothetical protein
MWVVALLFSAGPATAHIMQVPYNLPVPFWMYAYGATAALIASFVVVGYFVKADSAERSLRTHDISGSRLVHLIAYPAVLDTARFVSVCLLALAILTGLFGTRYPNANFNMTFFWIVFVLGFTYLSALIGDFYSLVNPWYALCDAFEAVKRDAFRPRVPYPGWLGYYPAFVLYMAFIWLELFGRSSPRSLSIALLIYTAINLAGAWTFGKVAWFRHAELFAVFLRLIGKIAPVEIERSEGSARALRVRLRKPFVGLVAERAPHFSLIMFVLFMLSSTAFDGIHETVPWVAIFWRGIYPVLAATVGTHVAQPYLFLVNFYYYWQWLMLFLSPFIYLAIYLGFLALAKLITRTDKTLRELALTFAYSLIPIALVYNITHYFTLLLAQGPSIASLISDPFGFGWNLFGTRSVDGQAILLDAGIIWHTQVWLILFGHIVSVYLSHVEALKVFRTTRQATLSQIPLLLLMVALTTIGLWILSLPIAAGQVLLPTPNSG